MEFEVPESVYSAALFTDYASAILANEDTLEANAFWIRDALIGLVWGIVGIVLGGVLLVVPIREEAKVLVVGLVLALLLGTSFIMIDETYKERGTPRFAQ